MKKENFIFFYGGIYSQWYPSNFVIDGVEYNCAEQYMMHQKALLFSDEKIANEIMLEKDPQKQKALGRLVKNFNVAIWDSKCEEIPALFTVKVDEQYFKAGPDIIVIWPMTTQPPKDSILI